MKLAGIFTLMFLAFSRIAGAQDNAGLFFYGPPPTVDAIARAAGDAVVSTKDVESVLRVTVTWPDVMVIIHVDSNWPRDEQLSGIRGAISELPARERNKAAVGEFLANLDHTTVCWATLIEPGYDREGKVAGFFKRLIGPTGGFLVTYQSFYSADGRRIAGLQDDPEVLE